MTTGEIAAAMRRVEAVLRRRPEVGVHEDAPAAARWEGGTRVVTSHANGTELATDMPREFGGTGEQVTPGWLFRAGLASCTATRIAMSAAEAGIELATLEVVAGSRSDTRGVLGMADAAGATVSSTPSEVQLQVRIAARGADPQRVQRLVDEACRCSPIAAAVQATLPLTVRVEVEPA
jgi:organic hydroperoxide reductase OsmC/OhrA